jgi:hypothetical protein
VFSEELYERGLKRVSRPAELFLKLEERQISDIWGNAAIKKLERRGGIGETKEWHLNAIFSNA